MSNGASAREQWDTLAQSIGYTDERHMWEQLYKEEGRSINDLARTLGFGTATIQRRLRLSGIERKKKGGPYAPSMVYYKLFHLDQRVVYLSEAEDLAVLCDASIHSIYRIRRLHSCVGE